MAFDLSALSQSLPTSASSARTADTTARAAGSGGEHAEGSGGSGTSERGPRRTINIPAPMMPGGSFDLDADMDPEFMKEVKEELLKLMKQSQAGRS